MAPGTDPRQTVYRSLLALGHAVALCIISCFTQKTLGSEGSRAPASIPQEKWLSWGPDPKLPMLPPMLPAVCGLLASDILTGVWGGRFPRAHPGSLRSLYPS